LRAARDAIGPVCTDLKADEEWRRPAWYDVCDKLALEHRPDENRPAGVLPHADTIGDETAVEPLKLPGFCPVEAVKEQLEKLPRGQLAREALEEFGALIVARNRAEAIAIANSIAPEHLQILTADAATLVKEIESAGAIFVGPHSPVAIGDYVAGPSHVLPTGGSARFASGLSANDFLKRASVIQFTADGLREVADDVRLLAEKEGLSGHSASVDIRLSEE